MRRGILVTLLCLAGSGSAPLMSQQAMGAQKVIASVAAPAPPETVLATFRVKPEQLAAFLEMMPEYWKVLRDMKFVDADPHVLVQGEEDGKPIVVQLFTWKSSDIPDHAPPEVKKYWDRMNAMVESRNGKPGIDFSEVKLVDIEHPSSGGAK